MIGALGWFDISKMIYILFDARPLLYRIEVYMKMIGLINSSYQNFQSGSICDVYHLRFLQTYFAGSGSV